MTGRLAVLALVVGVSVVTALWLTGRPTVPPQSASAPEAGRPAPSEPGPAGDDSAADAPSPRRDARKPGTLSLAVWNLRPPAEPLPVPGAIRIFDGAAPPARAPENDSATWRTTFGSERRDLPQRGRDAAGLEADVVALQGVTHMHDVVRTFPKRAYFAIVSRQLLAAVTDGKATPTTAVAVDRGDGLRVTTQDHVLLRRPRPTADPPTDGSTPPAAHDEPETTAAAVTAVKLHVDGKPLWVASADFAADCLDPRMAGEPPPCPLHARRLEALAAWIDGRRDGALRLVIAGTDLAGLRRVARAGDDVRLVPAPAVAGCPHASAGTVALLREAGAPALSADVPITVARGAGERCALMVEITH